MLRGFVRALTPLEQRKIKRLFAAARGTHGLVAVGPSSLGSAGSAGPGSSVGPSARRPWDPRLAGARDAHLQAVTGLETPSFLPLHPKLVNKK